MKVNFIVHTFDKRDRGGVLKVVSDLANNLVQKNIDVKIISFGVITEPAFHLDKRVQFISLNLVKYNTTFYTGFLKFKWFYDAYNQIKTIIVKNNSEVWITSSPPISLLFSYLKHKFNIKVIGCDHTSTLYKKNVFVQCIRNKFLKNLNVIVALTPQDQKYYMEQGINSICIPNGIIIQKDKIEMSEKKYLIFVGRFNEEKQPLKAIELFANSILPSQGIKMKMFGHGDCENQVKNYIINNKYEDIIEVITDEINPNIIYKDALVLLLTSKIEGFGMVLLEAIAKNVPCISFDCPYGPRNIIVDGVNGFLFDENKDDFNDLVGRINYLPIDIVDSISKFRLEGIVQKYIDLCGELSVNK